MDNIDELFAQFWRKPIAIELAAVLQEDAPKGIQELCSLAYRAGYYQGRGDQVARDLEIIMQSVNLAAVTSISGHHESCELLPDGGIACYCGKIGSVRNG